MSEVSESQLSPSLVAATGICLWRVRDYLRQHCLQRGEFTLASGQRSDHYLDVRKATMDAPMNAMIGQLFGTVALHHYTLRGLSYDAVGGMATAAIPLVTAMTMHGNRRGFYVRDNNKAHGTKQQIEGNLNKGDRVIIVDDVLTTGKSIMQAVQVVRDYGCEVVGVLCVVSRDPQAIDYLKSQGIQNVHALFSIAEILNQGVGV